MSIHYYSNMTFNAIPFQPTVKQYTAYPEMVIAPDKHYTAKIQTSKGDITISLLPQSAPKTVNSFVFLAKSGFYNDNIIHRVIPDFVIQAGDPKGNGTGGPGYRFDDEFNEKTPKMLKGTLAMANAGPGTNGSQFFICLADLPYLEGKHTPFGNVTDGMDIAIAIADEATNMADKPLSDVVIKSIEITEE